MSEEDAIKKYKNRLHRDHAYNEGSNKIDNCVLACKGCNDSKRKKDWDEWYTEDNKRFSQERFDKIVEWLSKFTYNKDESVC
jgi:5-methylcytosine-specific restriction endonuclease McrA